MKDDHKLCAVALSVASIPAKGLDALMGAGLPSPEAAYRRAAAPAGLKTQEHISEKYGHDPLGAAGAILEACASKAVDVIDLWGPRYPELLRQIGRPPLVLYRRGKGAFGRMVAVVGTRKADPRSCQVARRIASELGEAGFTVVSGMAVGIDREAHLGALEAGSPTAGVLANGIDMVYPYANRDLYDRIASSESSMVLSEYPPGIRSDRWTFARRNRIISGLSLGTVVVKAGEKSGALITARYALEQNREVFACPGHAFDESYAGCNALIREGAVLVSSTADILAELSPAFSAIRGRAAERLYVDSHAVLPGPEAETARDPLESAILDLLTGGERDVDSIIRHLRCGPAAAGEALMRLELEGRIVRNGTLVARSPIGH